MITAFGFISSVANAQTHYEKRGDWFESLAVSLEAMAVDSEAPTPLGPLPLLGEGDFTFSLWVKTETSGTFASFSLPDSPWRPNSRAFFSRNGSVDFDVHSVGCLGSGEDIEVGEWRHVAMTQERGKQKIYVDSRLVREGSLALGTPPQGAKLMLGYSSESFPHPAHQKFFNGAMDNVRIFDRALDANTIMQLSSCCGEGFEGEVAGWSFDDDVDEPAYTNQGCTFGPGHEGRGLYFDGKSRVILETGPAVDLAPFWAKLESDFDDDASLQEMAWERQDGIWDVWSPDKPERLARAYVNAIDDPTAEALAANVETTLDVAPLRELYLREKRQALIDEQLAEFDPAGLRALIRSVAAIADESYPKETHLNTLAALVERASAVAQEALASGDTETNAVEGLTESFRRLRYEALIRDNPQADFDKIVFIKRKSYNGNHYYTEFINGDFRPGGNICILDLATGEETEIVRDEDLPSDSGIFRRVDLSYDGTKIVFDWKAERDEGYRIFECNLDGSDFRQLTFRPDDEDAIQERYRNGYHHGTDDMDPCYLPTGEICFISTRCQYGILCDNPDIFTTTILYKIGPNGENMTPLSNSSVSEAYPSVTPDGRILYTRWEYVDKGSSCVKCLWSMRPDGGSSAEVYGNNAALPASMICGRAIPGAVNKYVMIGSPHCCPWVGLGTVIRVDMNKNIRTPDPMELMTPYVDVQGMGGEAKLVYQNDDGDWVTNTTGPIFRDPYPLSEQLFLVSHKPAGPEWSDPAGWGIYMLDEEGHVAQLYDDPEISSWVPLPLKSRIVPPVLETPTNPVLAERDLAACIVTDVYHGMDGVQRGDVKYLRVLEQVPRPWASRRYWGGDSGWGQQHVVTTRWTHLGLKIQHGVVPVEEDGSANFYVPAMANVFFQALDENYRAIQTERTYVNYLPGETRSCVGCHETPQDAATAIRRPFVEALRREPSLPGPQPGDELGAKVLDFRVTVQPVLDAHCIKCHNDDDPPEGLDLTDVAADTAFTRSYCNLLDRRLCGLINNEVSPKTGNAEYEPPYTFGSYSSILAQIISDDDILPDNEHALELRDDHKDRIDLTLGEKVQIWNWIDTNSQFYGSYWGRRAVQYSEHPNYRPISTFEEARMRDCPIPWDER